MIKRLYQDILSGWKRYLRNDKKYLRIGQEHNLMREHSELSGAFWLVL